MMACRLSRADFLDSRMIPDELKPDMRQRFFQFFEEDDLQVRI